MRGLWVAVVSAAALAACSGGGETITAFDDTPTRIEVEIASGNVSIVGNAGVAGAEIAADITEGDAAPSFDLTAGVLTVTDACDTDAGCGANYNIAVAGDADVAVTVTNGNVTVANLDGATTLDVTDGNVALASITGDVQVRIDGGDLLATRLTATTATFESAAGDLDVTFDEPVTTLVATTEKGSITVQLPDGAYAFETNAPDGTVDLTIDNDAAAANTVTLTATAGDITVYRR